MSSRKILRYFVIQKILHLLLYKLSYEAMLHEIMIGKIKRYLNTNYFHLDDKKLTCLPSFFLIYSYLKV